jgi:hypothetical protein
MDQNWPYGDFPNSLFLLKQFLKLLGKTDANWADKSSKWGGSLFIPQNNTSKKIGIPNSLLHKNSSIHQTFCFNFVTILLGKKQRKKPSQSFLKLYQFRNVLQAE